MKVLLVVLSAVVAACGPLNDDQRMNGRARIGVQGFGLASLGTVVVSAQPGNQSKTLVFDGDTNLYQGELVLPAGEYVLTVNGYLEGTTTLAATGAAAITVIGGGTTAATIAIVDQTEQEARPTINAIVRSVTASIVEFPVNTPTTLLVDVVNYDNKPVTYSWASDCVSGVFSAPSSATTTWMSSQAASCALTVSVVSDGVDFSATIPVRVRSGSGLDGVVDVGVRYVSRPRIDMMRLSSMTGSSYMGLLWRDNAEAMGANFPDASAGGLYHLSVRVERATQYGTAALAVSDDCGGVFTSTGAPQCVTGSFGSICDYDYDWTPPTAANTVCRISARATNDALVDEVDVAILLK
ncbi:hypothetical protein ACLESD_35100 [Pyxidicoccus sp. 3LFB2]